VITNWVRKKFNRSSISEKVSLSATRWLSQSQCVERILSQYDILKIHFRNVAEKERCYQARELSQMYNDDKHRLFLLFLHPVLKEVVVLVLQFYLDVTLQNYFPTLGK